MSQTLKIHHELTPREATLAITLRHITGPPVPSVVSETFKVNMKPFKQKTTANKFYILQ